MFSRLSPLPGPTAVELRNFLASEDYAMRQLRRSGLFVANRSHPAKSPVGATSSASMPLLRSFGFLPFALYKYAAPMGLKKAPLPLDSMTVLPGPPRSFLAGEGEDEAPPPPLLLSAILRTQHVGTK